MEKYELSHIKTGNFFFTKETFLVYPTLTNFTQRKRNKYDANDLLALSLVSIIVYMYFLGKKFNVTYLKTTAKGRRHRWSQGTHDHPYFCPAKRKNRDKRKKKEYKPL